MNSLKCVVFNMYFKCDIGEYWYEVHGQGEPVVLLHGFTGDGRTWETVVRKWKNSCKFIIIDLPGHGKTNVLNRTMEECCYDIKAILDMLSLEKVHMCGYSMGGRTALSFSVCHPEYIQSLVLESASPGLRDAKERVERIRKDKSLIRMIEQDGLDRFVDYWENVPLFASQNNLPAEKKQTIRCIRRSQSVDGLASSLAYMGTGEQPSWWNDLSTFKKPVLLLAGEYDTKYTTLNQAMQQAFVHSEFSIIKHAGHAIHVEQPTIFGETVMEFIFRSVKNGDN